MSRIKSETRTEILKKTWKLLEERIGQTISMSDIAKAVGISRQAVYLHFSSRTELMIATSQYVDQVKGLDKRLEKLYNAKSGTELLESAIETWGNYIPEIYPLAKALLATRDKDEASAAAWNGSMACLLDLCKEIIQTLKREEILAEAWSEEDAIDMLYTQISIQVWEQLTIECDWSMDEYLSYMKILVKRTFINETGS